MAKDLQAQVVAQINAVEAQPVILFEFGLDLGTLRYAASNTNITFGGNLYTKITAQLDAVQSTIEGQINRVNFRLGNVSGIWDTYADAEKFDGKSIIIKRVYRDALADGMYYNELLNGNLEEVKKLNYHWAEFSGLSGKAIGRQMLLDIFQRNCNHRFGYGQCAYDGLSDLTSLTASGTADSGSASTLVDSALNQAADYWNFGRVTVTVDGKTYHRRVKDFDAGSDEITFDVHLPVAVSNGDEYTVYKGCDQTWNTCQANNNWGPSGDNKVNFGGFLHINKVATNAKEITAPPDYPNPYIGTEGVGDIGAGLDGGVGIDVGGAGFFGR